MDWDRFVEYVAEYEAYFWVGKVFAIVLATGVGSLLAQVAIRHLERHAECTRNNWDDALVYALRRPVRLLVWLVGLTFAIRMTYYGSGAEVGPEDFIQSFLFPARDIGVITVITWSALRFIKFFERRILEREQQADDPNAPKLDKTTASAITKLLRISVFVTAILIAMQTLGFSISGLIAAGGVGGLAVGLAAKDLLANFFGALMIYFDRPFAVGDWIRSPDREIEGTVEEIGWRQTRIRTFDKRPLYVPNSVFTTISVENPSRMSHRRIHETIGVRYDDMKIVNKITEDVEKMLKNHEDIDTRQTLMVHVNAFGASSVDFFIYTFTKTTVWTEFHKVKQNVMLKIANIIDSHGAEIAFPTQTLHIPDGLKMESPELAGIEAKNSGKNAPKKK